ncbi:MAG TPA: methyl-accepting chemotaxis protein [Thermoanaerobaculia bacterium]|nr:methyl-accepting chemotaxis protein [Thermoanaerobaculia bacterium]
MPTSDTSTRRALTVRLRTKFIAAFVVQAFFITLLAVAIEEWRIRAGRGSPASDYILVGITALIVAFLFAAVATKLIIRPVLDLAETATRIADGDLTQRTKIATGDEIGELAQSFNDMTANLEKMLTKLQRSSQQLKSVFETVSSRSGTVVDRVDGQRAIVDDAYRSIDQLNSGVGKITDNVESLSAASEETSASMLEMAASIEEVSKQTDTLFRSVEETATATEQMVSSINEVDRNIEYLSSFVTETSSSMVEMTASIGQVEGNAARSYDLSLAAAKAAESGMKAVRETIEAMEHIRKAVVDANGVVARLGERSVAIGRILNVIEDVAEQTNLLALNAAILAAQAGEHGKGFSVVAGEIRELAERTASSTREIGALIQSVQQEVRNALVSMQTGTKLVEEGVGLSHEAGKALTNILESATTSSNMGKEIAAATNQQAKGSETVTRAVEKLQGMVKQVNAATAQQAQGSEHIRKAVDSMRDVARYVRQAMTEQKSGSSMISLSAEHMIERIHQIFQAAANQSTQSETIMKTVQEVRAVAEENRKSASEMNDSLTLLSDAIRSLDEEVRRFRVRA